MASTAALELVISLKDQASKPIAGITKNISALGTAVGVFAGGAALAGIEKVGSAITGFLGDAIQESRDAAKGLAQTQAAIKSTGGAANVTAQQIVDLAGSLSKTTLYSDDSVQSLENLLLTFTGVKNVAGEGNDIFNQTTKIALDMAAALGTDASGSAIQLGKALNDPIAGISALTRVGVTFTDQQKDQIKTLVESGQTMEAQKLILAELNKEFGGSAEAAAQADGGWHLFNQRLSDVKQTIGDALMPALTTMMTWISGPGLDMVEKFGTGVARWIGDTALPALSNFVTTIQGVALHVQEAFAEGGIKGAIDTLLFDIGKLVPGLEPVTTFLRDVAPGAVDASTTAWGLFRDSIITFKQAWDGDWKNADSILPLHQAIGNFGITARSVFDTLANEVLPHLQQEFETAMPENKRLVSEFLSFLNTQFFPQHKDGMNAQEKAVRDYGIEVGKSTEDSAAAWVRYLFSTDNSLQRALVSEQTFAGQHSINLAEIKKTIDEAQASWDNLASHTYTAWNQMGAVVYEQAQKIMGYIHDVTQAVDDLWNRLWSLTHTSWKVSVDQSGVPGGGGSSGFGGGGSGPPATGGGRAPNSEGPIGGHTFNFYGPTDGDDVVRSLRSVGMA